MANRAKPKVAVPLIAPEVSEVLAVGLQVWFEMTMLSVRLLYMVVHQLLAGSHFGKFQTLPEALLLLIITP